MKLRLRHTTRQAFGSYYKRDIWVGQAKDGEDWKDATNEYDSAEKAELMLLRWRLDTKDDINLLEPTFEH